MSHVNETKGIIIKSVDYGESDKIITILNEYGAKIPLMARRAKKVKSDYKLIHKCLCMAYLFIINGVVWEHSIL